MASWQEYTPIDQVADKVAKSGPLAPKPDEVKQMLRDKVNPEPQPALDVVGQAKEFLTKDRPKEQTTMFGETDLPGRIVRGIGKAVLPGSIPQAAGMAASMAVPGGSAITAPLMRAGAGGAAASGASLLQGKSGSEAAKEGALQAGGQLVGEAIPAGVRMWRGPERVAGFLVGEAKKKVPAFAGLPDTGKGLTDMVYGKGQKLLSESYDTALKAAVQKAREGNVRVPLLEEDMAKLGLQGNMESALANMAGRSAKGLRGLQGTADAAEVIEKVTSGWWKKDPALYRRVTDALDSVGVGDPRARAAYKTGRGYIEYAKQSKMIPGPGKLDVGAMKKGLTSDKPNAAINKRDVGDVYTGPFARAAEGVKTIPGRPHPWVTSLGMLEAPAALVAGHPEAALLGLGTAAGSSLLGKSLVARPPVQDPIEGLLRGAGLLTGAVPRYLAQ